MQCSILSQSVGTFIRQNSNFAECFYISDNQIIRDASIDKLNTEEKKLYKAPTDFQEKRFKYDDTIYN